MGNNLSLSSPSSGTGVVGQCESGKHVGGELLVAKKQKRTVKKNSSKEHRAMDTVPQDYTYMKELIAELQASLKEKEQVVEELTYEVSDLRRQMKLKDQHVTKLQREIHKLKSVLEATTDIFKDAKNDISTSLHKRYPKISQGILGKKIGVSGESLFQSKNIESIHVQTYEKDFRSKQLIKDAIMDNDFLKNINSSQVREIVDCMYEKNIEPNCFVIREGEPGAHLYVSAEGELEVFQDNKEIGKMASGKAFGELAILYNCTRTASVKAVTHAKVWVLDRKIFQMIMMRSGLQRLEENISFLRSVPLLKNLSQDILAKMADVCEIEFYPTSEYIIRQGTTGDTFYLIGNGKVKVTQKIKGKSEAVEIRTLERGDYFGEKALLREDCRTANVVALHPGVECLTLDRVSFNQLIGDLEELQNRDYGDDIRNGEMLSKGTGLEVDTEYANICLQDLKVVATLGIGGFGRVELVQHAQDPTRSYALKCLRKQHIVGTHQQDHVFCEKEVMMSCRSPFIARMYKTFRDSTHLYMLTEACLGGEVWTILRDQGTFDDQTARFYVSCVIEAFSYLHTRSIIFRDLKPENLLLDALGYAKLVDFGFAKNLRSSQKTWTFCGTPEYVAPEVILNKGHDRAVDFWSIGILMFELLTGNPPFMASDPIKTYNIILKGIDMIDFPRNISKHAHSLIKRLCRDNPSERLGYQKNGISDITKHKWFQGFDWDGVKLRTLIAPQIPQISGPLDTSNFDTYPLEIDAAKEDLSGWDEGF